MEGGGWLWFILDVLGVAILAAALIYGMATWRRRPKSPAAERAREEAVRENYRQAARARNPWRGRARSSPTFHKEQGPSHATSSWHGKRSRVKRERG